MIEEGRLDAGQEVPPEMAELAEAVEIITDVLEMKPARAIQIGRWVERWTAAAAAHDFEVLPPVV